MDQPFLCIVEENRTVALDTFMMRLCSDCMPKTFVPGQFVHLKTPRPDLILRRPISIHAYDADHHEMTLIYQVKGEGTQALARCQKGDALSVLGPLGAGFPIIPDAKRCILIGGGIGCAPLLTLPKSMPVTVFDAALGYRSMAYIYQKIPFENACRHVLYTTDDGSYGHKGYAMEALQTLLLEPCDAIYACGPTPMLKALQALIRQYEIPCYASLEERMGCGMGACVTCACGIQVGDALHYKRVCKDGPVFDLSEVVF